MATLLGFAVLVVYQERERRLRDATEHVAQLSDVITRSTRFAMLQARPDYVHNIIADVARQENIDRVRIFNKEGTIIDSTQAAEVGLKVDRNAEGVRLTISLQDECNSVLAKNDGDVAALTALLKKKLPATAKFDA